MSRPNHKSIAWCWVSFTVVVFLAAGPVRADRPLAPDLLPEKTLACLRVPDTREFVSRLKESAMGRMLDDEQMRPLVSSLYGVMAEAFGQIQDQVGLGLDELLAVPQGELCVALVVMPDGSPSLIALLDVGEQQASAQKLLDRAAEELAKRNVPGTTEMAGSTKLSVYDPPGDRPQALVLFQRDTVVVLTTQVQAARQVIDRWNGEAPKDQPSFAQNRKYTSIMNRCGGAGEDAPQITWFVDPIELARLGARGNFTAQTGLALLPALGLDGVQGAGGSMILGSPEFDGIQHMHLLLDSPRSGVLKALAITTGDSTPEPWVPQDAANYMTLHWEFDTTFAEVTKLVDSFQTPGTTAAFIKQQFSEPLGIDVEKEVIAALSDRVTYVSRFEKPARINSQTQLVAVKLRDAAEFRRTLDKVMSKFENVWERKSFGSFVYFSAKIPDNRGPRVRIEAQGNNRDERPQAQLEMRAQEGCVAVLGDYLVLSDSSSLLQQCVSAQADPSRSLASELDFKLIASKVSRQVGGQQPSMLLFNRPEEGLRMLYELAQAENSRKLLAQQADRNAVLRSLNDAVTQNPLPPFSVIAKYFAPAGGMVVNDETGVHYMAFSLRRK